MKEKNGVKAIESHLPKSIYRMSTTGGMMSNGSPDKYYDGVVRDCWVEYKSLNTLPRNGLWLVAPIMGKKSQPNGKLSVLQLTWLLRRHQAGQNAFVILILPNRTAVVLENPREWTTSQPVAFKAKSFKDVATWIQNYCIGCSSQQ